MTITNSHRPTPPQPQHTRPTHERQHPADHVAPPGGAAAPRESARDPAALERSLGARQTAKAGDVRTQHLLATLTAPGETRPERALEGATVTAADAPGPQLRDGYESLTTLSHVLPRKDPRFSPETPKGRAALAMALAIGGTEAFGKDTNGTDFFTRRGGTGDNMLGFAQFNLKYHRAATKTPEKYSKLLADMLTGKKPLPNSTNKGDHAGNLVRAVESGAVKNGEDLKRWMRAQGFGGSNWQGIDDGWGRVPGLGDDLVKFLREGSRAGAPESRV